MTTNAGSYLSVLWWAKRQTCTVTSTTAAEIISLSAAITDAGILYKHQLEDVVDYEIPVSYLEDNVGCVLIARRGFAPAKRHLQKHMRLAIGFCAEHLSESGVNAVITTTGGQRADLFTKSMVGSKYQACRDLIRIVAGQKENTSHCRKSIGHI
jgi:hypothetical protein